MKRQWSRLTVLCGLGFQLNTPTLALRVAQAATGRLALEAAGDDVNPANGFYRSRREIFGRFMFLLALQKAGQRRTFILARPNTGMSFFEMDADELRGKYLKVCVCVCVTRGWVALHAVGALLCAFVVVVVVHSSIRAKS